MTLFPYGPSVRPGKGSCHTVTLAFMACTALLLAGCATGGATPPGTRAAAVRALDDALAGNHRSEANRARDAFRHPRETLLFFGLRPGMTVVELWPGDGWYTEVIAPVVNASGRYYAAQYEPNPANSFISGALQRFDAKLKGRPDLYGGAIVSAFGPAGGDIAPPGSADLVVTFRNLHNWMARDFQGQALATVYRALKPGGTLGVVEHRGNAAVTQDPKAASGYVNEAYAIRMIESAGFRLVAKSELNANPRDTKDYPEGVWTLPPTYRLGERDRARYTAIGESDRFTLRFEKPRN
jgi:predicted methyltransferase